MGSAASAVPSVASRDWCVVNFRVSRAAARSLFLGVKDARKQAQNRKNRLGRSGAVVVTSSGSEKRRPDQPRLRDTTELAEVRRWRSKYLY